MRMPLRVSLEAIKITAGTFPEAWEEVAIVSIMLKGGTAGSDDYQYAAPSETIDISEPDFEGETVAKMVSGGRLWKETVHPTDDGEITLELYPVKLNVADDGGLFQHYSGQEWSGTKQWDATEPLTTQFSAYPDGVYVPRERFLVAIMWTDDTTQDSAIKVDATGTSAKVALRFWAKECRLVSMKSSFTDGILKQTVTFRFPSVNKAGDTRNFAWESSNDMVVSGDAEILDLAYA